MRNICESTCSAEIGYVARKSTRHVLHGLWNNAGIYEDLKETGTGRSVPFQVTNLVRLLQVALCFSVTRWWPAKPVVNLNHIIKNWPTFSNRNNGVIWKWTSILDNHLASNKSTKAKYSNHKLILIKNSKVFFKIKSYTIKQFYCITIEMDLIVKTNIKH